MLHGMLVKPYTMYWPASLVLIQLFNTLHDKGSEMTRRRVALFTAIFIGCFIYQVSRPPEVD